MWFFQMQCHIYSLKCRIAMCLGSYMRFSNNDFWFLWWIREKKIYIWVNLKFCEKKREKAFMPALKALDPEQLFTYQLYSCFMQDNFSSTTPHKYCSYKNVWWWPNSLDFVDNITEANDAAKHPQVQKRVYIYSMISLFFYSWI